MNVIDFGQEGCKKAAKLLDAFLNNELSAELAQSVAEHVESCPNCSREVAERSDLRDRVKKALGSRQSSAVEARLRGRLREESQKRSLLSFTVPLAAAATLLIGVFSVWQWGYGPREAWRTPFEEQEAYVNLLYTKVANVMQSGLGDHVHCSHYRRYPVTKMGGGSVKTTRSSLRGSAQRYRRVTESCWNTSVSTATGSSFTLRSAEKMSCSR